MSDFIKINNTEWVRIDSIATVKDSSYYSAGNTHYTLKLTGENGFYLGSMELDSEREMLGVMNQIMGGLD